MNHKIEKFQKLKHQLSRSGSVKLIYRGDSLYKLYKRFGIIDDKTSENRNELLKRIFLIGDKARYFYKDEILKTNEYERNIALTDSDDEIIDRIFLQINSAIKSSKEYLSNYFELNKSIKDYFGSLKNRKLFVDSINATKDKFRYRNYYLTILHQLYFIEYKNNTHFVSTSTKFEIAKSFAGKNGVVIHCWLPVLKLKRLLLKKNSLPRQTEVAFNEQYEISLTAGILPHYIIGVEFLADNEFYFNSNILENEINQGILMFGLDINQGNFFTVLKKTSFRKSFFVAGKKFTEHNASR
jgi:hypothetical protein